MRTRKNNKRHVLMPHLWVGIGLLFLFACSHSFAQAKFYATAPKSVPVNQQFSLTYTLENANGDRLSLPSLDDFQVLGGPSTSTSVSIVNNSMSQSVSYTYYLKPKKEGTFKIGKGTVEVSGVKMESNELSIEVTKAVAQQPQAQRRQYNPYDPFSDPFFQDPQEQQQQQPQVSQEQLRKQIDGDVFVKLLVSKNTVYKGEMLTATYRLYFRRDLTGYNITKAPAFDGFWSQEVDLDPHRRPSNEVINGKQYYTIDLLKYNLYPQRTGALPLAPLEMSTTAQVVMGNRRGGFFDPFGYNQVAQVPLDLKANAVSVTVKDLPETGKPDDFYGAVGQYTFNAKLSSAEGKTDDPLTYSLKISGTGNLKFIEAPTIQFPKEFEAYDPKTKESINNGEAGLTGSKQYDYLIIPREPGEYKIESQAFSYFDPASAKYFSVKSPEFSVKVTGEASKNLNAANNTTSNKEDVSLIGQDILYIKTAVPEFNKSDSFFGSAGFVALYTSPFLLFLGLIAVKRRNETMAADIIGTKRRRALKLAKKRLSLAHKHLIKADKKAFYAEVSQAVWGYLCDKLNIDLAELSKDNVEEKLLSKQSKTETIDKLKNLINICELALYSPVGEGSEMKHNYDNALNLIADIEDEVK